MLRIGKGEIDRMGALNDVGPPKKLSTGLLSGVTALSGKPVGLAMAEVSRRAGSDLDLT